MSYPIIWVPASAEDFRPGRNGKTILAIVHHRMVGTLPGTDRVFQSTENRPVSTHFGIGHENGRLEIHQYVDLSDTAFGNGNYDPTGSWDDWGYPTTEINARTVSIEHEDNGGRPLGSGRGIVTEDIIVASLWLDKLLLSGDITAIRAAGIRIRDAAHAKMLGAIVPGPRTIITHRDISGKLKPFCWLPWADDKVGFPRTRYVTELTGATTEMAVVITKVPETGTFVIPAGVSVTGFTLDAAGNVANRKVWSANTLPSSAAYLAKVGISSLRGNPFLSVANGFFAGYYLSTAGLDVRPDPVPDVAAMKLAIEALNTENAKLTSANAALSKTIEDLVNEERTVADKMDMLADQLRN